MKSETRRLNKLTDTSHNLAKRYKLPEAALKIIEKAGKIHGQQSRAIQVAVELIWNSPGYLVNVPDSILKSPQVGKTYKLPPRTVSLIEALGHEYETQGNVLAACAVMLSRPDPREGLTKAPPLPPHDKIVSYEPVPPLAKGETMAQRVKREAAELSKKHRKGKR
jgi:hypothetical protein